MAKRETTVSSNKVFLPLLFVGSSILMEIANYLYLGFKSSSGVRMIFPTYFMFDLAIILMLAGVIFLCQNKILQNIVFYLFISIHIILNIVNTTMYGIFGDILSYDLLSLGAEATTALSADLIDWWGLVLNLSFLTLIITSGVLLQKFNKKTITIKYSAMPALIVAIFILFQSFGASMLVIQQSVLPTAVAEGREIEQSDVHLWENFQFKLDAYKKFGHFGFYAKSIVNIVENRLSDSSYEDVSKKIDEGYRPQNVSAPLYGDNLMVVLCESLDWYAIDPILTPTLYSLAYAQDENAIAFSNFYGRNRTNISEGITLLGSMPRNTLLYNSMEKGYTFDYALPKLFKSTAKDKLTKTQYVHENYESFYKRNLTHGTDGIGFDEIYSWEDYTGDYDFAWEHWVEDYEFSYNQIENIFPTDCDRFLTYYATISTHGPYTKSQPNLEKYYKLIDDNWSTLADWMNGDGGFPLPDDENSLLMFKRYKAGIIDFDRTVNMWLQELDARGLKDNTTILFFADHNSYYSNLCYRMKGIAKTNFSNTYINNIPMFIYSPHLAREKGSGVNEVYCNTYDILPTICDLFGLPTNTTQFQGYSIYSENIKDSFFSSNLNGMFTKDIYSLNISEIYLPNGEVSNEEIERFKINANKFYQKQDLLEKMYANGLNGKIKII